MYRVVWKRIGEAYWSPWYDSFEGNFIRNYFREKYSSFEVISHTVKLPTAASRFANLYIDGSRLNGRQEISEKMKCNILIYVNMINFHRISLRVRTHICNWTRFCKLTWKLTNNANRILRNIGKINDKRDRVLRFSFDEVLNRLLKFYRTFHVPPVSPCYHTEAIAKVPAVTTTIIV